jgi:hypothetical protein
MAYTFSWVPTTGQNNSFVQNNNTGKGYAVVQTQQNPFNSPLYICVPPTTFQGGDAGAASLYDFAMLLATTGQTFTVANPAINYNGKRLGGGRLTINGNPCGNYEYNILPTTTLIQTSVATLFSSTNDISSWIVCKGNLTLDAGITLIPTVTTGYSQNSPTATAPDGNVYRRLFMVVYVTGTLTLGTGALISMSACGGNSDTLGANIASFQIPVANGLTTGSPSIAAQGSSTTAPTFTTTVGIAGPAGVKSLDRYSTGGGGSGYMVGASGGATSPGSGGAGSCFSGGTGGGNNNKGGSGSTSGSSLGGAGGDTPGTVSSGTGGTGNPGGTGTTQGNAGTGGILIIIAGSISGASGSLAANGVTSGSSNSGGASGGGIILQISGDSTYIVTTYTSGGAGISSSAAGGTGIAGNYTI